MGMNAKANAVAATIPAIMLHENQLFAGRLVTLPCIPSLPHLSRQNFKYAIPRSRFAGERISESLQHTSRMFSDELHLLRGQLRAPSLHLTTAHKPALYGSPLRRHPLQSPRRLNLLPPRQQVIPRHRPTN